MSTVVEVDRVFRAFSHSFFSWGEGGREDKRRELDTVDTVMRTREGGREGGRGLPWQSLSCSLWHHSPPFSENPRSIRRRVGPQRPRPGQGWKEGGRKGGRRRNGVIGKSPVWMGGG